MAPALWKRIEGASGHCDLTDTGVVIHMISTKTPPTFARGLLCHTVVGACSLHDGEVYAYLLKALALDNSPETILEMKDRNERDYVVLLFALLVETDNPCGHKDGYLPDVALLSIGSKHRVPFPLTLLPFQISYNHECCGS
ncbi:hypothetical protein GUJ93_ZPchr0013g34197 [Zizania palustris]|uniref:Uncharacterized protein n=1 Tax=Zizania palustris TaxID=103762 RepID=A0A8J5X4X2_ZIZPA|nr:hypothetical protein GUJ93_ZPchr0013g34197 [Zizania palustris]